MTVALDVRSLGKHLGGRWVVRDASFTWSRGLLAVTGGNGAGKSTLLRLVAGVIEPDLGSVHVHGAALSSARALALSRIAYVPESPSLPDALTVRGVVELVASLRRAAPPSRDDAVRLGVDGLLSERIGTLSLGQRRRVAWYAALAGSPDLVLMDEPTNGLDAAGVRTLTDWMTERIDAGAALLIATHDPTLIDRAHGTLALANGQVIAAP